MRTADCWALSANFGGQLCASRGISTGVRKAINQPGVQRINSVRVHMGMILVAFMTARAAGVVTTMIIPSMFNEKEWAVAGGLMSYGENFAAMYRRAAYFVDRIFKGAKPADLPVEQAVKFDMVLNLRTAKAIGLTIPDSIMVLADEVIN
jgi:hypothetical protein